MFEWLSLIASSMNVAYTISMLLEQTLLRFVKKRARSYRKIGGEDKISALPDDLLVNILLFVPTKDAVATMILSKRWRSVWTMVPKLGYQEINDDDTDHNLSTGCLIGKSSDQQGSIWRFIDESLKLHKAPVLETLVIELGRHQCPVDVDVGKWIANAVNRKVRELDFTLTWSAEPASLSKSLYTCDTLVKLYLSDKILVDVPSSAYLPSLKSMSLYSVVYKDEDSIVRLLSSCPVLTNLYMERHYQDNVTNLKIKVPSLECLLYDYFQLGVSNEGVGGSLVIDSPALKGIFFRDVSGDSCSFAHEPRLEKASICVLGDLDDKFMRSLSSSMNADLCLSLATVAWFTAINWSRLMECKIILSYDFNWLESLTRFLQNSPNMKVLSIDQTFIQLKEDLSFQWNEPGSVPGCLSAHLEVFEWEGYRGRRGEKEAIRYIFANSKCLKKAGISVELTCKPKDKEKMMKELESMVRVSTSSQLIFSTQLEYLSPDYDMSD